ncbi:hypothetical protein [Nitrosopumilus sp.]|uniref:hypothetical protein n=1 Tax=Nitrosopumilus sp. TaxID=2024843 RepID=UPI003D11773C
MKLMFSAIVVAVIIFFLIQIILPFPYGLIIGSGLVIGIIWYGKKQTSLQKDSVLNYRRIDPINEEERTQNDEALRILEKQYIEERILKEEYLERKKEFEDLEYNPRKCESCGSEDFEFISEERVEEPGEHASDIGHYKCKKCGRR